MAATSTSPVKTVVVIRLRQLDAKLGAEVDDVGVAGLDDKPLDDSVLHRPTSLPVWSRMALSCSKFDGRRA